MSLIWELVTLCLHSCRDMGNWLRLLKTMLTTTTTTVTTTACPHIQPDGFVLNTRVWTQQSEIPFFFYFHLSQFLHHLHCHRSKTDLPKVTRSINADIPGTQTV